MKTTHFCGIWMMNYKTFIFLQKNLPSEHCPFSEILAEASDAEMQLRKRGLSMKCIIRARKVTPAEGTYSQYGLSSRQKKDARR